jgi:hypothetical protein
MKTYVKCFAVVEACLVVLPCAAWWGVMWGWPSPAGRILYKMSFYFVPAALCFRSGFGSVKGIIMPHGALDWLVVIGTYSVVSLMIALICLGLMKATRRGTQNTTLVGRGSRLNI